MGGGCRRENRETRRGALFDSGGEGSDVISTSAIHLSKSILCLFVFNILQPAAVRVCVCVCLCWSREGGAEERGATKEMRR